MAKHVRPKKTGTEAQRDLDLEISFLEGVTRRDPVWTEAWKLLADNYTKRGRVEDGLRVDEFLARTCSEEACVFYNLACSYSLAGKMPEAFTALRRAFALGYDDLKWLAKDPDMAPLRRHPEYKEFLGQFNVQK